MKRRLQWQKIKLDDGTYESAGVFDVNNDGKPDIVCGAYWYEAPDWKKHKICDISAHGEYYDDFSTIPLDINGDGYLDFITGGWWGGTLQWMENPKGKDEEWKTHVIDQCGNIETTRAWDIDGDGELEIVPNTPGHPLVFYKLIRDDHGQGTGSFRKFTISSDPSGHGLGFGDILLDGKKSILTSTGWWTPSRGPLSDPWEFHPEWDLGITSVPILAVDFNSDGLMELIAGQAHGYGLFYYSQKITAGKKRVWERHPIDPYFSQYHEMQWVDIDNDGEFELITGNRYRAHCGNDPGETNEVGVFCFTWNGESFTKQVIDFGKVPESSGTGIHMAIADIDGDGWLDIVAPGKEGLYLFRNYGPESAGKSKE